MSIKKPKLADTDGQDKVHVDASKVFLPPLIQSFRSRENTGKTEFNMAANGGEFWSVSRQEYLDLLSVKK